MYTRADVDRFLTMLTTQQIERLEAHNLDCPANREHAVATVFRDGRTYWTIAVGTGIRYFIRKADGMIFASATWKSPNLKRSYGTLGTIDNFNWGEYNAVAKPGTGWVMQETAFGYMTAVKA